MRKRGICAARLVASATAVSACIAACGGTVHHDGAGTGGSNLRGTGGVTAASGAAGPTWTGGAGAGGGITSVTPRDAEPPRPPPKCPPPLHAIVQASGVETDAGSSDARVADAASPDAGPRPCLVDISGLRGYWGFDPYKLNVQRTTPAGVETLYSIESSASCNVTDGLLWYYDDRANPTRIAFCPRTCETLLRESSGMVVVLSGCGGPAFPLK
jgi:hypothetical protein